MRKREREPHEPRRGWLKNGNPPGDLSKASRCGAKTRAMIQRASALRWRTVVAASTVASAPGRERLKESSGYGRQSRSMAGTPKRLNKSDIGCA